MLSLPKYHTPEITVHNIKKGNETKRRNGTFSTSKPEEKAYAVLVRIFGEGDIVRQYISDAYPFRCDFYIKSMDTYVECNFHWTHGGHWFDPGDDNDTKKLMSWKEKVRNFMIMPS